MTKVDKEDRFERHDQGECRPWASFKDEHPDRKQDYVYVDEVHGSCERGDLVCDSKLRIGRAIFEFLEYRGVMHSVAIKLCHGVGNL
jgi:hypothetical protein